MFLCLLSIKDCLNSTRHYFWLFSNSNHFWEDCWAAQYHYCLHNGSDLRGDTFDLKSILSQTDITEQQYACLPVGKSSITSWFVISNENPYIQFTYQLNIVLLMQFAKFVNLHICSVQCEIWSPKPSRPIKALVFNTLMTNFEDKINSLIKQLYWWKAWAIIIW